jgi:hypothetical protein
MFVRHRVQLAAHDFYMSYGFHFPIRSLSSFSNTFSKFLLVSAGSLLQLPVDFVHTVLDVFQIRLDFHDIVVVFLNRGMVLVILGCDLIDLAVHR